LQLAVGSQHWNEAALEAKKLLALRPNDAFALKVLGSSLLNLGRELDAIPPLHKALNLAPQDSEISNNLGIAHLFAAHWELAIQHFRQALALKPKDYVIWKNLGRTFVRLQRPREAVEALAKAIELHPDNYHEALILLALALSEGGQLEQSFGIYRELYKNGVQTNEIISSLIFCGLKLSEHDEINDWLSEFRTNLSQDIGGYSDPLASLSFPGTTWEEHYRIACQYALGALPNHCNDPAAPRWRPAIDTNRRRLRIGYFSGDFRRHPVGYLIPEVLELHDRERFEILGYAVGDDDQSEIRARIAKAFDRFTDLGKLASDRALNTIRADNLDVLINLQGWTNNYGSELFAEGVATVQISWLGYPGTMGHRAFADYLIGDPVVTPLEHAGSFTETLAQLDTCYLPMDTAGTPPEKISRRAAGVPEDRFIFCSFNNRYKINPMLVDLWSNILNLCPNAVLWISGALPAGDTNLRQQFAKKGIATERIICATRVASVQEHRQRIGAADLALDTMPYNSHSSGLDMLWAGVPMVTMLGQTLASRVGASLMQNAGLAEMITASPEAYCQLAVDLYHDRPRLKALQERLCAGRSTAPLWNMRALTRNLERIITQAYDDFLAGRCKPICAQTPASNR
jgi:predicted O-linked N-acetylglucosamine transferase (SPINDLY family)